MKKKIVSSLAAVILVATMIGCTSDAEHVDKQPVETEVVTDVFVDTEKIQSETETVTECPTESVKETEEVAILKPLVDGKVLVTKATEYDADGSFQLEEIFEYDTAGRMTHYSNTMAGGYVLEEEHREYDNNGNLTLIKNKKYENYSTHYTEYEYDSNNYMVEESIYWKDEGEVPNPTRYCYKYDSKGNMIECTQIEGEWTDTYIYEYNSNNQLVKEYLSKWPDDATIYEYDSRQNKIKETCYVSGA